ncbi:MAG: Arm DNA-binding domain-containing protein [Bacteroidaceae bacterium]|nr:Arm DNA-binding domain-containing protein [Bacteroidaceae bacterium]
MEKHCTTVYFLLKKTRKDKNGDSPIDAWIAVNGERTSYSTGKKVKVSEWDEKKQLVKGTSDKANLINEYLYQLRNKIFQKEIELMEKGFMLTPTLLKDAVNDHVEAVNQKTLMQVFNDFQTMRKPLIGKKIAKDTYEDNDLTGRYIKEFMKKQYCNNRPNLCSHKTIRAPQKSAELSFSVLSVVSFATLVQFINIGVTSP